MKVVLFNGSFNPKGNTFRALSEIAKTLNNEGIETEICHIGGKSHMTISNMIVVGSSYWNVAFGREPGECEQDLEGMQTMRNLARNMAWLLKCVDLGKQNNINPPLVEYGNRFNFIR